MTSPIATDASGRISGELVCVQCGYLLRGQPIDSRCPECGGTVQLSIDAQRLATWPAAWLRRLRFGLRLLICAIVIGWLAVLVLYVTTLSMLAFSIPAFEHLEGLRLHRYEWALAPPLFVGFVLAAWGTVTVTFSEAARIVASERPRAPWLARIGLAIGVIAIVVLPFALSMTRGTLRDRMIWLWLALVVGGMVAVWNLSTSLARLARRIPDECLARRCETFRWLALLAVILAASEAFNFWAIITWLPIGTAHGWWRTIAIMDTLILTGRVAILAAGVVAVFLLRAYARRLTAILRDAGEHGTSGT